MVPVLTRLLRGNRELSTLVVCVVLALSVLLLSEDSKTGISHAIGGPLRPFKQLKQSGGKRLRIQMKNERLLELVASLMNEREILDGYRQENERLRELLDFLVSFSEEETLVMLPARVTSVPGTLTAEGLQIDKGRQDGVGREMPVVVPAGVVGKISGVDDAWSHVEPLSSLESSVSVTIQRSRVRGILRPRYEGPADLVSWSMEYVPPRSDVQVGDKVVTSGIGQIYPPGLRVGTVTEVAEGPLTMSVSIEPAVRLSTLEHVFVVTDTLPGERRRTEEEEKLLRLIEELRAGRDGT